MCMFHAAKYLTANLVMYYYLSLGWWGGEFRLKFFP